MKWRETGLPGDRRVIELSDPRWVGDALADAGIIISCVHARYTASLLAAAPQGAVYVLLGCFRRYARVPDGDGLGVQAGEAAWLASGRHGVMLHPALTYGPASCKALAAAMRGRPLVLLPGGGRVMVQPLHEDDLARCLAAAADHPWPGPRVVQVPGPERLSYAAFLRRLARAAGQHAPAIIAAPRKLCGPTASAMPDNDQAFAPADMLGVRPAGLNEGLARSFTAA
jgi:uncharacterized protein YbjT (DUF2867 family)